MDPSNPELGTTPREKRAAYSSLLREASGRGIRFAVGGSLAVSSYSGLLRPIKDLDVYVTPGDKDCLVSLLSDQGFEDYFDRVPYDRGWIYRAFAGDLIVDVIWQMANRRAYVDECWLTRGPIVEFENVPIRLLPVEEMVWNRLYVLQRDRCDWPDVFNLLDIAWDKIDWLYLKRRVQDDLPLLNGLLKVYTWLRPEAASRLPDWSRNASAESQTIPEARGLTKNRAALLDSRPWLVSVSKEEEPPTC